MMEKVLCRDPMAEAKNAGAPFSKVASDADCGTQKEIEKSGARVIRCTNHGGKNIGNAGIDIGKDKNLKCSCPVFKRKSDGKDYETGKKNHRPITLDIARRVQGAFSAVTSDCGPDSETWLARIPQLVNHYYDLHSVHV